MSSSPESGKGPFASIVSKYRPELAPYEKIYKHIHANPELSMQESETASLIAEHLRKLSPDFDIRTSIGGTGVIAILENKEDSGQSKTILLRADMDALPVKEETGFEFASKKTMKDDDEEVKPVMHACGHDLHVGCFPACFADVCYVSVHFDEVQILTVNVLTGYYSACSGGNACCSTQLLAGHGHFSVSTRRRACPRSQSHGR